MHSVVEGLDFPVSDTAVRAALHNISQNKRVLAALGEDGLLAYDGHSSASVTTVPTLGSGTAGRAAGGAALARASVVTGVSSKSKFVPSTVASQLRFKSPSYGAALTPYKLSQPMPVSKKRGGPKSK